MYSPALLLLAGGISPRGPWTHAACNDSAQQQPAARHSTCNGSASGGHAAPAVRAARRPPFSCTMAYLWLMPVFSHYSFTIRVLSFLRFTRASTRRRYSRACFFRPKAVQ